MAYDRVLVRDLGSRNQVRVNGQVVEESRLRAGDELAIGPILYRLELEDEPREGSAPAPGVPASDSSSRRAKPPAGGVSSQARRGTVSPDDSELDLVPLDDL
jgi:hypothetical protein